jgi:peroxiredoxin
MPLLNNGDPFPVLTLETVTDGTISVPDVLSGSYGVVLIYRGSWCPYCNAQLAAYAKATNELANVGIKVVALSADTKAAAADLVRKHGITFPVGHGIDADLIAVATGAYVNRAPHHLQSTGFVLDPEGRVITAVYSSRAIGRLVVGDVIGFVSYVKSQKDH